MRKLACILICQPTRTKDVIKKIDEYFFSICQTFQNLYGTASCTINLHLHCHLGECLRDYGPVHDTWCFSFKRLNGILRRMPSNKKSLQIEKMLIIIFVQQIESWKFCPLFTRELQHFPCKEFHSISKSCTDSNTYVKHIQLSNTINLTDLAFDNSLIRAHWTLNSTHTTDRGI